MHKVIGSVGQLKDANCPGRACYSEVCRKEEQNRMCFLCGDRSQKEKGGRRGCVTHAELLFSKFPIRKFIPPL